MRIRLTTSRGPVRARPVSAWWACSCPPHDALRRTRPAPRCPRAPRGPLNRPPCLCAAAPPAERPAAAPLLARPTPHRPARHSWAVAGRSGRSRPRLRVADGGSGDRCRRQRGMRHLMAAAPHAHPGAARTGRSRSPGAGRSPVCPGLPGFEMAVPCRAPAGASAGPEFRAGPPGPTHPEPPVRGTILRIRPEGGADA